MLGRQVSAARRLLVTPVASNDIEVSNSEGFEVAGKTVMLICFLRRAVAMIA